VSGFGEPLQLVIQIFSSVLSHTQAGNQITVSVLLNFRYRWQATLRVTGFEALAGGEIESIAMPRTHQFTGLFGIAFEWTEQVRADCRHSGERTFKERELILSAHPLSKG